jgi:hypothetical protein
VSSKLGPGNYNGDLSGSQVALAMKKSLVVLSTAIAAIALAALVTRSWLAREDESKGARLLRTTPAKHLGAAQEHSQPRASQPHPPVVSGDETALASQPAIDADDGTVGALKADESARNAPQP